LLRLEQDVKHYWFLSSFKTHAREVFSEAIDGVHFKDYFLDEFVDKVAEKYEPVLFGDGIFFIFHSCVGFISLKLIHVLFCRRKNKTIEQKESDYVEKTSPEVVDMLVMFAKEAVKSVRRDLIFLPYPLVFDIKDKQKKIFDPEHKDYDLVEGLLGRIPSVQVISSNKSLKVSEELDKISPYAHPFLNWLVSSNHSIFVRVPDEIAIPEIHCKQFLMMINSREKEIEFRALRQQYGSVLAFHGSPAYNWHSIVRSGLKVFSGTNLQLHGTAYGHGIYMSPYLSVASAYAHNYGVCGYIVVAVLEVIDHDINVADQNIWTIQHESHVTTRMLLLFKDDEPPPSSYRVSGSSITERVNFIMSVYDKKARRFLNK